MTSDGTIAVGEELFTDVLPRVEDLTELKAVLEVVYQSARRGTPTVPAEALLAPDVLRRLVSPSSPVPAEERMMRALDRAVANGFLLRVVASRDVQRMAFFALATAANRDLVERLRGNDPTAVDSLALPPHADLSIFRPTIFSLYEEHIGPLTPLVAERVRDAERLYPRSWIEEAIETAVHYNKRNWRYIEAILSRWEETGASHGVPGRNS